jgi:hypothetical protein
MRAFWTILFAVLLVPSQLTFAWLRMPVEDHDLVARSELIVVGGIKEGSVHYVPHEAPPDGRGRSWEHHAILIVRQVLKGKCDKREIPLTVHYGLSPLVDGHMKNEGTEVGIPVADGVERGSIQILDTGNSSMSFEPLVADARQDNVWFLRRLASRVGDDAAKANFGIGDPEDVQRMTLKDYLLCYLGPDPEAAVRDRIGKQPDIADRAMRYLDHREIERIIAMPDVPRRVERLIPYYVNRSTSDEAARALVAAGPVAGPYLLGLYTREHDLSRQDAIIRLWGRIRWDGCGDMLISLLEQRDKYWSQQELKQGWWNDSSDPGLAHTRHGMYGGVYSAVWTLRQVGDRRAKAAVEQTRKTWSQINFDNKQIVEECDAYLHDIDKMNAATKPAD